MDHHQQCGDHKKFVECIELFKLIKIRNKLKGLPKFSKKEIFYLHILIAENHSSNFYVFPEKKLETIFLDFCI